MPGGGAKAGERRGGRKPGTQNKPRIDVDARIAQLDALASLGITKADIAGLKPLDVMLLGMRTAVEIGHWTLAVNFAKEAAPYVHPRLASETHRLIDDDSKRSNEELERELAEVRASQAAAEKDAAHALLQQYRLSPEEIEASQNAAVARDVH